MNFNSMNDILDFAISKEEEARDFYNKIAQSTKFVNMRQIFIDFAQQEEGHRERLLLIKAGKMEFPSDKTVRDLKIGDYLVDIKAEPNMNYQQALIVAMKAEKNAYIMYAKLAEAASEPNIKSIFRNLAAEEANHKLRFEMEYDAQVLAEN
jgi:rubrerythrin